MCGGGCAWQEACMVGGHVWQGSVHAMHAPLATHAPDTTRYSWSMRGGTHPTGMHSFY